MIGYLFILLAVFFNAVKGYSSKKASNALYTVQKNVSFNTKGLTISFLLASIMILFGDIEFLLSPNRTELGICVVAGVCTAGFACLWQYIIRSKAYMLASAASAASFIIPCICGLLFWDERFTIPKASSIILIIGALFLLLKFDSKLNGKIGMKELLLLFLLLASQGVAQCTQKMHALFVPERSSLSYNFYMFVFAVLSCVIFLFVSKIKGKGVAQNSEIKVETKIKRKEFIYMFVMSLALFATSLCQAKAAESVDAIILYPLLSGLSLVAGTIMSVICFHQKLDRNGVIGIILVIIAIILSKF